MTLSKANILTLIISWFLVFFIIGNTLLSNIGIAALIIFWFFDRESLQRLKYAIRSYEFWAISSIFWLTVVGLFYTELSNQGEGLKYVERRLGLLIFPLILGTIKLPRTTIHVIKRILFYSIPFIGFAGLLYSLYNYNLTGKSVYFYNNNLLSLFGHQAVYFSLYINAVLLVISDQIIGTNSKKKTIFYYLYLALCLVFQYFLASRLSLLLSLIIVGFIVYQSLKIYIGRYSKIIIGALCILLMIFLFNFSGKTIDRFKSLKSIEYDITSTEEEYNLSDEGKPSNWNGLTIRLAIWKCAGQLINDNYLIGVGTGDYKSELHKYFKLNGFEYGIIKNYTTHNQFIYIFVAFGSIGLIIFIIIQALVVIRGLRYEDKRFTYLLLLFFICFLTENILNRNQGIITFGFFASFLLQLRNASSSPLNHSGIF